MVRVSHANVSTITSVIPMKAVDPNVLATPSVLLTVLVYARNVLIPALVLVALRLFVPSTTIYPYVHVLTVILATHSFNVLQ